MATPCGPWISSSARGARPQREVRVCSGFRSNGRETQNRVRWHTATYELSVREARTGRELAKTTAEATNADCPMFQTFNGESETVDGYASLSDTAVADFLRPHITREAGADGGNSASPTP